MLEIVCKKKQETMEDLKSELIDYLENLPKRRLIKFSKDFQSDDYFSALGQLRKSINGVEPSQRALDDNKEVCEHPIDKLGSNGNNEPICLKCGVIFG